jgi:4-hydroxy-2-oxoheptanedioate aldolase
MSDLKIKMRPSRVLAKLRAGKPVFCTKLNLTDPRAVEIAALFGFDCVWLCREHVPNTLNDIENMIRAAKMYNVDSLVRVPRGGYNNLIHPLEMDAAGIMVPHCMSAEDARQIVYYTKFHPIGRRPIDGGNADSRYCLIPNTEYAKQANEQRFVMIQIEDPEVMDDLDEIAAMPGVDMLLFGGADYSQGLGVTGQSDDPRIADARKRVAEAARKHGKFAGIPCSIDTAQEMLDLGYQFITIGADVAGLTGYFGKLRDDLEKMGHPLDSNT